MEIVKKDDFIYSDLDTFYYSCPFRDDESDYSYGCSHEDNETDGQCLDCGCPLLYKVDKEIGDTDTWVERILALEFKRPEYSLCDKDYLEQVDGWGEDTCMCCDMEDFHIFNLNVDIDYDVEVNKYINSMGLRGIK